MQTVGTFLRLQIQKKRDGNPRYSLRALARDVGVSPAFLSRVLDGTRKLPPARIADFRRVLKLDARSTRVLQAHISGMDSPFLKARARGKAPRRTELDFAAYRPVHTKHFKLLGRWYAPAVLDLSTCEGFNPDPAWIAARLGLGPGRVGEVREAMEDLVAAGLARRTPAGGFEKSGKKMWFGPTESLDAIRAFHRAMLERASEAMTRTDAASFEARRVSAITLAANPARIEAAKARLEEALTEIAEILTEGPCTEVYQLNLQLFPLTRPR